MLARMPRRRPGPRLLQFDRKLGARFVAGADEAGRGPLAGPLLVSTDAWTYWEYGRIAAVHDGDPYVDTPSQFPDDPAYDKAGADWRGTTSVYGPAFTLLSECVALVSGSSAAAAAWIFKVLAALGVLACTLLAARLATLERA